MDDLGVVPVLDTTILMAGIETPDFDGAIDIALPNIPWRNVENRWEYTLRCRQR